MSEVDLDKSEIRDLNAMLHSTDGKKSFTVVNPNGKHNIGVGIDGELDVTIEGHAGHYVGGMNKHAAITVTGNAGAGLGENIMSGVVRVKGNSSQYTGATGRGGLIVVEGDAAARCGISMKGVDIVVGGNVGHMCAFLGQSGNVVVCGDAGDAFGDSIFELNLFVQGKVKSLGTDCEEKEMDAEKLAILTELLDKAEIKADPKKFKVYGPGRNLYNFKVDNAVLPGDDNASISADKEQSHEFEEHPELQESATWTRQTIKEIQRAATEGIYSIRGGGAKRKVPHFDDLLFLGSSMSRYPLEGYREKCDTDVTLGTRYAKKPLHLDIPITIAGMSFGALSAEAKDALGQGAAAMNTTTTTGDGGMTQEERASSKTLVIQMLPSRYGMNPDDLRAADAIEVVCGQGAKPGGGGMLLGQKISDRVAMMRTLPKGIDQRSACRHPDWTGPDDLEIKINEIREITDWEKPIYVKVGATRTKYDVQLAVKAGADVIVVDGMQGGTAATQDVFMEHVGIPTLPAVRIAVEALQEMGMHRKVQLIVSGGIRNGADVAKCMALGADAVSIGMAALYALGCNSPKYDAEYRKMGSAAGYYDDYHIGQCPAGISTQDPELAKRFDTKLGGRRVENLLKTMVLEAQTLARACGKSHLHNLEPEDLVALTMEAAAMAKVPLAGTDWYPGKAGF